MKPQVKSEQMPHHIDMMQASWIKQKPLNQVSSLVTNTSFTYHTQVKLIKVHLRKKDFHIQNLSFWKFQMLLRPCPLNPLNSLFHKWNSKKPAPIKWLAFRMLQILEVINALCILMVSWNSTLEFLTNLGILKFLNKNSSNSCYQTGPKSNGSNCCSENR